jgi:hypothetical protein|tara:strand:- start:36 stop:269 length:234 start_codon:yes stop_codon:yes gene_type:complete
MTLSNQVEYSLREAQEALRNALSFSARSEKSYVSKHIADMLANIDNLIDATELIEKLNERQEGDSGMFGTFFGDSKD